MTINRHITHIKSKVANQLPTAQQLYDGEIAINYHKGTETLSIKNDADEVVSFKMALANTSGDSTTVAMSQSAVTSALSSITTIIEDNEEVVAAALNDLNTRVNNKSSDIIALSGKTITAGAGLSGGGAISGNPTISINMTTYSGTTMPTVPNDGQPIVYVLVDTSSTSLNNETCPITLNEGQQCNVIYKTSSACTIVFGNSNVITEDANQLTLTTVAGGYCEVNYIKLGGNIFLRGA